VSECIWKRKPNGGDEWKCPDGGIVKVLPWRLNPNHDLKTVIQFRVSFTEGSTQAKELAESLAAQFKKRMERIRCKSGETPKAALAYAKRQE